MEKRVEYSVVIPTYDRFKHLERLVFRLGELCRIDSEYSLKEVIIADDGSTDERIRYSKSLLGSLAPIRIVRTEHLGVTATINKALDVTATDFVVVISSDAVPESNKTLDLPVRVSSDPIGYLVSMLDINDEAGFCVPLLLAMEAPELILVADYGINPTSMTSFARGMLMLSSSFLGSTLFSSRHIVSARQTCVAFRTQINGNRVRLDDSLTTWYRWMDDLAFQFRSNGYVGLLTANAIVSHPIFPDQPPGSHSVLKTSIIEEVDRRFYEKWQQYRHLTSESPRQSTMSRVTLDTKSFPSFFGL